MKVTPLALPEVKLVEPAVFGDARGYFLESFSARRYDEAGVPGPFVQDNLSRSRRGVLRGLHLQHPHAQGKLVSVLDGEVFDVAVDVRVGSPTFGRWVGEYLSAANHRQLWVPPGFLHGFVTLTDDTEVVYKCTGFYDKAADGAVRWDSVDIDWGVAEPVLSDKDRAATPFDDWKSPFKPTSGNDA